MKKNYLLYVINESNRVEEYIPIQNKASSERDW